MYICILYLYICLSLSIFPSIYLSTYLPVISTISFSFFKYSFSSNNGNYCGYRTKLN